ncbi:MAG: hypothetical protein LIP02_04190 [Bacteroidales bacterium]|nr:hypothetical protein [Bacteroidales bacterium]
MVKQRLTQYLDAKRISKAEFGRAIGVSKAYISSMRSSIAPDKLNKIQKCYPDLDIAWLLTGEGEMLTGTDKTFLSRGEVKYTQLPTASQVPVLAYEVLAGFSGVPETSEEVEEIIDWPGAEPGDVAVRVKGVSMSPNIPEGALVLLSHVPVPKYSEIRFGRVYVVCLADGNTVLKVVQQDTDRKNGLMLMSYNPAYHPMRIPAEEVVRLYFAKSVQFDL